MTPVPTRSFPPSRISRPAPTHREHCLNAVCPGWPSSNRRSVRSSTTTASLARRAADASTERWRTGRPLSPIDGMPVGIKDIIETADMPTEQGSPLFAGWETGRDAASVAALREAGAVILGKTVTTEFAATEPRGTRNPWDPERTPGGSSSGSAAAVGCGMVPAALGTQVVGSIIRPASFCGCVGYKPSVGGINRGGSYDYFSQSCTGVLAASLEDAWLVAVNIAARAGGDPGYPGLQGPSDPPAATRPRRLAVLETAGWNAATPEARDALEAALARIAAAGVAIARRGADPELDAIEAAIADAEPLTRADQCLGGALAAQHLPQSRPQQIERQRAQPPRHGRGDDARRLRRCTRPATADPRDLRRPRAVLRYGGDARRHGPARSASARRVTPSSAVPGSILGVPTVSLPVLSAAGCRWACRSSASKAATRDCSPVRPG